MHILLLVLVTLLVAVTRATCPNETCQDNGMQKVTSDNFKAINGCANEQEVNVFSNNTAMLSALSVGKDGTSKKENRQDKQNMERISPHGDLLEQSSKIYSTCKEVVDHRTQIDAMKNSDDAPSAKHENLDIYRRILEIYDLFEKKSDFGKMFGNLSPTGFERLFESNRKTRGQLKMYAKEHGILLVFNILTNTYQTSPIVAKKVLDTAQSSSLGRLYTYPTCQKLIQNMAHPTFINPESIVPEDRDTLAIYCRVIEIYSKFEKQDDFMKLFWKSRPKAIFDFFSDNQEQRILLERHARKYGMEVGFDAASGLYKTSQLSLQNIPTLTKQPLPIYFTCGELTEHKLDILSLDSGDVLAKDRKELDLYHRVLWIYGKFENKSHFSMLFQNESPRRVICMFKRDEMQEIMLEKHAKSLGIVITFSTQTRTYQTQQVAIEEPVQESHRGSREACDKVTSFEKSIPSLDEQVDQLLAEEPGQEMMADYPLTEEAGEMLLAEILNLDEFDRPSENYTDSLKEKTCEKKVDELPIFYH